MKYKEQIPVKDTGLVVGCGGWVPRVPKTVIQALAAARDLVVARAPAAVRWEREFTTSLGVEYRLRTAYPANLIQQQVENEQTTPRGGSRAEWITQHKLSVVPDRVPSCVVGRVHRHEGMTFSGFVSS